MKLITLAENEVFVTLCALALLLGAAYLCGKWMEWIKAPKVVGEILGGILLGGTCLTRLFPDFMTGIFQGYAEEGKVLNVFYQLGLIFLMFSSGFNTKLSFEKKNTKLIACIFVGSTILPMAAGLVFIDMFRPWFIGANGNTISYPLVFLIGIAITSIPVISKIFFDMGIIQSKFANLVLTVSTFQDLLLWILLNVATRIAATGNVSLGDMLIVVVLTLGMFAVVNFLTKFIKGYQKSANVTDFYTISFIGLFVVCALLNRLGINIMYSAFLVGYVVRAISEKDEKAAQRMQSVADFSFSFFVPVYFALVGIQLNLLNDFSPVRFLLFFLIAFALEGVGTGLMLLFTNLDRRHVVNFAVTMNARGGPGIVLATVAYSYEIINLEFFTVLILTTMLSSLIAGYWLRLQQKKDADIFMNLYRDER